MTKFSIIRAPRFAAGLVLVAALAAAPMSAQADTTNATGTITGGSLTNSAPDIAPFSATLTGINQTIRADVDAWSVNDATGSNDGYNITVSATAPTVAGSTDDAGTGATLSLTPSTATRAVGNPNPLVNRPVASAEQLITGVQAATIQSAAADKGQGAWDFPAVDDGLAVVIPGDASEGAYSSTLTFTTAEPAA